ncbi:MAG: VWA domain-containing protein [Clostridia bacterium]|nr:VWA domain-containing protein [Clostridia bacterium]
MVIKIIYVRHLDSDSERTRIVIPTGIAPRFMYFGSQIALESLFEEVNYNISLSVICKNFNIKNVVSPTHDIVAAYGENCVEIFLRDEVQTDKDIVIDVFSVSMDEPKFIKYENYISCSFVPEVNVYEETPRDYLFIVDVSSDMNTRKIQQVKNALNLCIRTLKNGDRFNLAFAQSENTFFSYEYLPLNDDTLRAATKWISSYVHQGVPEFYRPLVEAYDMTDEAIAIFISDGRIGGNSSILNYAKEHKGLRFYNFGFDMAVNQDFLNELSSVTGGKTRLIGHTERIDDTIVKAFNVIVSPSIDNAVIRFDSSVSEITPRHFNKIHCGERINIMFKYNDQPPTEVYIKGLVGGKETISTVSVNHIIEGGREIEYRFGYESINNLLSELYYADEQDKYMLRQAIVNRSVDYSVHSKYTMFKISDKAGWFDYEFDVDKSFEISSDWYEPSLDSGEKTMIHSVREIQYAEIMKKQRANGRFIPSISRSKEAIAFHTANIVTDFCKNCANVYMYRWHLRKSVLYLLDYIENSDYGLIPKELIEALTLWQNIFGGTDDESQKINVLKYLHQNN